MKIKNNKKNKRVELFDRPKSKYPCVNCGELDYFGHFVPPSMREPGFFICAEKVKTEIE